MNSFVINNIKIVTPREVLDKGFIYVKKGVIDVIEYSSNQKLHRSCTVIDGSGKWLFPGMVDMFSTAYEKAADSGENLRLPMESAIEAMDSRLVVNGITTVYHAINTRVPGIVTDAHDGSILQKFRENGSIRHNLNIVHNIGDQDSFKVLENLLNLKDLQLVSVTKPSGSNAKTRDRQSQKNELLEISEFIDTLTQKARKYEIRIASYNEGSHSKLNHMKKLGIKILEFPQQLEAPDGEIPPGMKVLMGAPDIVRSVVYNEKSRTLEGVLSDTVHMLCSQNEPASLINAVFLLHRLYEMNMAEAFRKVSANPAAVLGIDKRIGSIECGKYADLVLVREADGKPFVEKVFINGFKAFEKNTLCQNNNMQIRMAK